MTLQGIDISSWQAGIDLSAVPADFVIVKATQGTGYVNPDCSRAIEQARAIGKYYGIYHYISGGNAQAEADYFIDNCANWIGNGLLAVDWEQSENNAYGDENYLDQVVARIIQRTGVIPLIYGSQAVYQQMSNVAQRHNCGLWVAQYADMNTSGYQDNPWNEGAYDCAIRQYSSSGQLAGYGGALDLDKFYGDGSAWQAYAGANGVTQTVTTSPAPAPSANTYTVVSGDTLSGIAARFGTTWQALKQINGIQDENVIKPGQILTIGNVSVPSANTYTVVSGDTLSGIAARFGTTWQALKQINGIQDENVIKPGQILTIG